MRAALIYQRESSEAQEQIANRLSKLVDDHRSGHENGDEEDDGTAPV
jgi:hypothetical protein